MATITPVQTINGECVVQTWTGITTTTDAPAAIGPFNYGPGALRATVVFGGTFVGSTAVLHGSIDGTNYAPMYDIGGNAISATAAKAQDFSSSCLYIKPVVTGGVADDVDVVIVFRK